MIHSLFTLPRVISSLFCSIPLPSRTWAAGQTDSQVDGNQRKFWTCLQFAFRLATHLRWLALTLVGLRFVRVDASFRPTQVDRTTWSQVICVPLEPRNFFWVLFVAALSYFITGRISFTCSHLYIRQLFATCVNLRADLRIRLTTHRKSIRKFWFCKLASTCKSVWPELCTKRWRLLISINYVRRPDKWILSRDRTCQN